MYVCIYYKKRMHYSLAYPLPSCSIHFKKECGINCALFLHVALYSLKYPAHSMYNTLKCILS